jgi:hypothetical protein
MNEVDIVPLAHLFVDEYLGSKEYLTKLLAKLATYIKEFTCWPA